METRLKQLYALQQIDLKLDELEEQKGDLPAEVRDLEARREELVTQRTAQENQKATVIAQRDHADSEIVNLKGRLGKYKDQQFHVRNNREYDALTREMDTAADTITNLEKSMSDAENKIEIAVREIGELTVRIEELDVVLTEKRHALAEVSKATEDEELQYQHQRKKIVARIPKDDLDQYHRIRRARNGRAVVQIKRGACGGCFNTVPPNKILELRKNSTKYTCERCGRILVSDQVVEAVGKLA